MTGSGGWLRQLSQRPLLVVPKTGTSLLEANTAPSASSIRMEAMVARRATLVELTGGQRAELEPIVRAQRSEQRLVKRARVAPLAEKGLTNEEVAQLVGLSEHKVGKWRRRVAEEGLDGLADRPRCGWAAPARSRPAAACLPDCLLAAAAG